MKLPIQLTLVVGGLVLAYTDIKTNNGHNFQLIAVLALMTVLPIYALIRFSRHI